MANVIDIGPQYTTVGQCAACGEEMLMWVQSKHVTEINMFQVSSTITFEHEATLDESCILFLRSLYREQETILNDRIKHANYLLSLDLEIKGRTKNMAYDETPTERNSHVQEPFTPSESRQDPQVVPD